MWPPRLRICSCTSPTSPTVVFDGKWKSTANDEMGKEWKGNPGFKSVGGSALAAAVVTSRARREEIVAIFMFEGC